MFKGRLYLLGFIIALVLLGLALVPTVPYCGPRSEISLARYQYSQYINALQLFRSEYQTYPDFLRDQSAVEISNSMISDQFVEALSGLDRDGNPSPRYGNRRAIPFHTFTKDELIIDKATGNRMIRDNYGIAPLVIYLDHDNDGYLDVINEDGITTRIRVTVAISRLRSVDGPFVKIW